ncbi:MAG: SH3 domain-containing protein [Sarcina sp.]
MNRNKMIGLFVLAAASSVGITTMNLGSHANSKNITLLTQQVQTGNQTTTNNETNNNNGANNTLTKAQVQNLKNKTVTVNGMKFKGLETVKIAPRINENAFAATPGFNPDGFASSVNEQLYNYELNPANDKAAMTEATQLHDGNPIDTCVYFQSSALRAIGQGVPYNVGYTSDLANWLANNGWTRHTDFQYLQKGDICFASTYHTFLFMGWENKAKGIAYVMGDESFMFPYYSSRNLSGQSPVTYGNNSYYQATSYWTYGNGYQGAVSGINPVHQGGYNAIGTTEVNTNLNIRAGASTNNAILGRIPNGTTIPVISQNGAWFKIYYNGITGWIDGNYTNGLDESLGSGSATTNMPIGSNLKVTSPIGLWLTTEANGGNGILVLPDNTPVKAIAYKDGWYKVDYEGTTGWIDAAYTSANGSNILNQGNTKTTPVKSSVGNTQSNSNNTEGKITINTNGSPLLIGTTGNPNTTASTGVGVPNGTTLTYSNVSANGWYLVNYNGTKGWVSGQYVTVNSSPAKSSSIKKQSQNTNNNLGTATINSQIGLWLNEGPSMGHGIEVIPYNAEVKVLGESGNWTKVEYNGQVGWCYTEYITVSNNSTAQKKNSSNSSSNNSGTKNTGGTLTISTNGSPLLIGTTGNPNTTASTGVGVPNGTTLTYSNVSADGWYLVDYNGTTGWISGNYVNVNSKSSAKQPATTKKQGTNKVVKSSSNLGTATVNSQIGLWLNENPAMGSGIEVMPYNAEIKVLGESGNWTKVEYNGQVGWCYSEYISVNQSNNSNNGSTQSNNQSGALTINTNGEPLLIGTTGNPNTTSSTGVGIPNGTEVNYSEVSSSGWYLVNYNGTKGWVDGAYVTK